MRFEFHQTDTTRSQSAVIDVHGVNNIKSEDIYNVDESGVSVNPKFTSKIVAKKGIKQVGGLTAAERGETVTAELCMSATGKFMPPMLIFPRVNRNEEFLAEAPAGAWGEFHKSGWIQNELFTKWFKEFIKFSQASEEKKSAVAA